MKDKARLFKDVINSVRDELDIYPRREVSCEETLALMCYEIFKSYKNIINTFESNSTRYDRFEMLKDLKLHKDFMEYKFDNMIEMLKDLNIEYYENQKE